ncbi:MAG: DUF4286 family protein [Ignavibacteria bacterium]|nr:DUF4286 family protein [Ignavibacteria bacterium]
MILYNVTVNIDSDVHDIWLDWMISKHIPDVLSTGLFINSRIYRIKTDDEEGGINYSVQYFLNTIEDLETYQKNHASKLQSEHKEKFGDKFTAFRTILESVDT